MQRLLLSLLVALAAVGGCSSDDDFSEPTSEELESLDRIFGQTDLQLTSATMSQTGVLDIRVLNAGPSGADGVLVRLRANAGAVLSAAGCEAISPTEADCELSPAYLDPGEIAHGAIDVRADGAETLTLETFVLIHGEPGDDPELSNNVQVVPLQ